MNYGGGEEGKIDGNTFAGWSGFTDKAIRAVFIRKVSFCASKIVLVLKFKK